MAVRVAPWADVADAVGPRTRLVVLLARELAQRAARAGGAGAARRAAAARRRAGRRRASPVDVAALGAAAYAAAGQKWLCGPEGTGLLFVSAALRERMRPPAPGYVNLADPAAGLDAVPHDDARAYDTPALPAASLAQAVARSMCSAPPAGTRCTRTRRDLAATAADALRERGRDVLARDRTTLVTWREPDAEAAAERLAAAGVVVRSLPGEDLVRASFGGWSSAGRPRPPARRAAALSGIFTT